MTDLRLIAYAPNGARQGPIPAPQQVSASYVLNDTGALTLSYPPAGPMSSLLGQPVELVTELSTDGGATWAEPINGRFLYLQDGRDPTQDGDPYAISAPGYITRLGKALVPFTGLNSDGNRAFTSALPGTILNTLLSEAQARGALTGMSWGFTAAQDSAGVAWPAASAQTIAYSPGTDFLQILQGMAEAGLVDYRTNGRTLQVYAADTVMANDRTDDANRVALRWGKDLTEAPFRRTWEALADTAYVLGDNLTSLVRTNGAALTPWGRQETFVTASGVTDSGTLQVVADGSLDATAAERVERTYGLTFQAAAYLPFRDYLVGDWVYGATDGNAPARMRVRQITLTRSDQGVSAGNVVLNDRFVEQDILQARKLAKVLAGATLGTSGTPSSSPVGNDILAPAQVLGLGGTTAAYVGPDGYPRAQITLDWADVTTNADGTTATDVDHYEVHRRRQGDTTWTMYREANLSFLTDSPYQPNEAWEFKVRAVDRVFNRGAFSATVTVTTASDTTAPAVPSQPAASSTLRGQVTVTWDGKTSTGGAMDADLAFVEVHRKTVSGFVPVAGDPLTRVATLRPGGGNVVLTAETVGVTEYIRLIAVDTSYNPSAASVQRSVTVGTGTDGLVPTVPGGWAVTLTSLGVGSLEASWPAIANPDLVRYDVYAVDSAPVSVFSAATFIGTTTATRLPISALPGGALLKDTNYYVAVRVRDDDGTAATTTAAGPARIRAANTDLIAAGYVYAGNIEAAQIKSGSISADLALVSGSLQVGTSILMSDAAGIVATHSDGSQTIIFGNGSGSVFSGTGTFASCVIKDKLSIQGDGNSLGGSMRLSNGVLDPAVKPTVSDPGLVTNTISPGTVGYDKHGLATQDTLNWLTTDNLAGDGVLQSYDKHGGGGVTVFSVSGFDMRGGVATDATYYYICGVVASDGLWHVRKYRRSDNVQMADWQVPGGSGNVWVTIGSDATSGNIVYARRVTGNGFRLTETSVNNATIITDLTGPATAYNAQGVVKTAVGMGATRYVVAFYSLSTCYVYNSTTAAQVPAEYFDMGSTNVRGLVHDGTVFHAFHYGDRVTDHTTEPGGSKDAAVAWYDDNTRSGGTYATTGETLVGPRLTFTARRFGRTTISTQAPQDDGSPDAANTVRIYAGLVGGTLYLQTTLAQGVYSTTLAALATSGTTPKVVSDFASRSAQSPGRLFTDKVFAVGAVDAGLSIFDVNGGGSGRAGPIAWSPTGAALRGAGAGGQTTQTSSATANAVSGGFAVTFPVGRFAAAPAVTVTAENSSVVSCWAASRTATGFTLYFKAAAASTAFVFSWTATAIG